MDKSDLKWIDRRFEHFVVKKCTFFIIFIIYIARVLLFEDKWKIQYNGTGSQRSKSNYFVKFD